MSFPGLFQQFYIKFSLFSVIRKIFTLVYCGLLKSCICVPKSGFHVNPLMARMVDAIPPTGFSNVSQK